jgi:hypothetical protein
VIIKLALLPLRIRAGAGVIVMTGNRAHTEPVQTELFTHKILASTDVLYPLIVSVIVNLRLLGVTLLDTPLESVIVTGVVVP